MKLGGKQVGACYCCLPLPPPPHASSFSAHDRLGMGPFNIVPKAQMGRGQEEESCCGQVAPPSDFQGEIIQLRMFFPVLHESWLSGIC